MEQVKVDGKAVNQEELKKIKEEVQKDKKKLLKEVQPGSGDYRILSKMNG